MKEETEDAFIQDYFKEDAYFSNRVQVSSDIRTVLLLATTNFTASARDNLFFFMRKATRRAAECPVPVVP